MVGYRNYTEGDATINQDESTCITKGNITPFEKCTYVVESSGGTGKLYLSDNEVININKAMPNPTPTPDNGGGKSGGSVGIFGLLGMGLLALRRKFIKG